MEGPGQRAQGPDWVELAVGEDRQKYVGSAIHSFRDLIAWQKAMDLAVDVYALVRTWARQDQYGLGGQLQRSACSIAANIAEGYERRSTKEYLRFLAITFGSIAETEAHLILGQRLGLCENQAAEELQQRTREIGRIVRGIERGLGRAVGKRPLTTSATPQRPSE